MLTLALAWLFLPADVSWWSVGAQQRVNIGSSFIVQLQQTLDTDDLSDLLELPDEDDDG